MKKIFLSMATLFALTICINAQNTSPYWSLAGNSNAASTSKLGTTNNISLRFYTNNVQRMIINSAAGLVGIGTTTPTDKLHINSPSGTNPLRVQVNGSTKLRLSSGGGVSIGSSSTPPVNGLYVSGKVGIGTISPQDKLHVNGTGNLAQFGTGTTSSTYNYWYTGNDLGSYIEQQGNTTKTGSDKFRIQSSKSGNNVDYSQFIVDPNNGFSFLSTGTGKSNVGIGIATPAPYRLKISHATWGLDIENAFSQDDWELLTDVNLNLYSNSDWKGTFSSTSGSYSALSDERLKANIKPMAKMLDKINQLKPSTYQFKNTADKQEYNGFIAQDVMKIFPALVTHNVSKERNLDVYALDYSGFGVIAIKGIQELQPIIEEQQKINKEQQVKITTLEERIMKLESVIASITANNNGNIYYGSLEQNKPNPFNKNTIIRYNIPQGSKGQINIYDQAGKLVKALKTNENGSTELSGYGLAAGTYTYTLMINGKVASSKQMLVIK